MLIAETLREKSLPLPIYACPSCADGLIYRLGTTRACGSCGARVKADGELIGRWVANLPAWRGWCERSQRIVERAKDGIHGQAI